MDGRNRGAQTQRPPEHPPPPVEGRSVLHVTRIERIRVQSDESQPQPPLDANALVDFFTRAARPDRSTHLVGTELEKFGIVLGDDGSVSTPTFEDHIAPTLQGLVDQFGWKPGNDRGVDGQTVDLIRDGASITLEPGGQFELSGAPLADVHETCAEFTQHYRELDAVSRPLSMAWMTAGFHPWATRQDVHWMPKGRYRVMRDYLPTRGGQALDMMLRTCTVQANFDYADEADCGRRFRVATAMAPLITAMFANSPYIEGRATGLVSARSRVWTDVDPDRCGIPRFVFEGEFSFQRYVDWALDVPMFFVKRDGHYHPHHVPFRTFMEKGFTDPDGKHHRATNDDWTTHLSTVFPETRLKPHLEVRSPDAVPSAYVCGLPALAKGVLYDDDAAAAVWESLSDLSYDERITLWRDAYTHGLASKRVQRLARIMLDASRAGLTRIDVRDAQGRGEWRFLDPLEALVDQGVTPGDSVKAALGDNPGTGMAARRAFAKAHYFAGVEIEP
ncbi:MAG: glutamate--cysteine ligase [Nannocystaceae bacterium]|nr:glutamate--cysteine ligase [Nannocystaceae bacterium]